MKILSVPIDEVTPYWRNPRRSDRAVSVVAESISRFGFNTPIIVDENRVVIAGHTRLRAARQLGLAEVPVLVRDDLPPEKVKAYRIADNATAAIAKWDRELLTKELLDMDLQSVGVFFREGELVGLLSAEDADRAMLAATSNAVVVEPENRPRTVTITCPGCAAEFKVDEGVLK